MLEVFRTMFPNPKSELRYTTDFEFLVAVILSAQSTDAQVNKVTEKLFKKYPTIESFANADIRELEKDVFSTGYYRSKARYLKESAKMVLERFGGELPRTMREMRMLPGVGRKTANVVLSNLYGIHEGIAVDTHVMRISQRFDLVDPPYTATSIERDLMEITPQEEWGNLNHYMVLYGRYHSPAHAKIVDDPLTALYPPAREWRKKKSESKKKKEENQTQR